MNGTEKALAASLATIAVLGLTLATRNRQLKIYQESYRKLHAWGKISQQIMTEVMEKYPEFPSEVSEGTIADIEFYGIMSKENLI